MPRKEKEVKGTIIKQKIDWQLNIVNNLVVRTVVRQKDTSDANGVSNTGTTAGARGRPLPEVSPAVATTVPRASSTAQEGSRECTVPKPITQYRESQRL